MSTLKITLPKRLLWQQQVVNESKRFNVINVGRRAGKTTFGFDRCATKETLMLPVSWFSPTYKMLSEVWRLAVQTFAPITSKRSVQEHRIEFVTGGLLEFWSLDNQDAARGRKYRRVIVDEAAMVPNLMDAWNYVLRPTLADYKGDAYFLSTPKGRNGFWQMYQWGQDADNAEWMSWKMPSTVGVVAQSEIDAMRDTMPELTYRQEILAEFLEGEGTVFRNIAACTTTQPSAPEAHRGHTIIGGADWGKQQDYTTFSFGCIDCHCEVAHDRFNKIDYAFQVQRLKALADKWQPAVILTELNSIGQPVFEQVQRLGLPAVGFNTTAQSKPPLIENLALVLEKSEWKFIDNKVWTAELEAYERTVSSSTGRSSYSAPDGMNDDTVISRALMVWQANKPRASTLVDFA